MMPIGMSFEREVQIGMEACKVYVTQTSKTVWRANGTCRGESYTVKGSSASSALAHWRETASYHATR